MGAAGRRPLAGSPAAPTCAARHHVAPQSPDAEEIAWFPQTTTDRVRVADWSCPVHDEPAYELCVLGAVWFVRRRTRMGTIHETHREPSAVMRELWFRLLGGSAR